MRLSKLTPLFLLVLLPQLTFAGPKLPKPWKFEDLPQWDAGVRGGIPNVKTQITLTRKDLAKAQNCAARIQKAIDSIKAPGAVLLPEGTYELSHYLNMRNGVVLRGSDNTHLRFNLTLTETTFAGERPSQGSIRFEGSMESQGRPLTRAHLKGETLLAVDQRNGLEVGDLIEIFSENDPHLLYTESRWNRPWAQHALGQIVIITDIAPEGLSIDTPLRLNYYPELNPRIRKITPIENAGVENLSIERIDSTPDSAIGFENALNCWVKDSQSFMAARGHIWINHSRFITVQGNEVHHGFNYGSGGSGYGIVAGNMAVDSLIVNNILHDLRHSMMAKKGSNGNVFAYNYSHTRRRTPEGEPLICDISLHGHYSYQNLFEGNVVEFVDVSDHWGPTGPDTTFYRNRILTHVKIRDHSHNIRLIGNVLLEGRIQPDITVNFTSLLDNLTLSQPDHQDPTYGKALPPSLYYSEKPDFWTDDLPWPAIGPDTDTSADIVIPAQQRHQTTQ